MSSLIEQLAEKLHIYTSYQYFLGGDYKTVHVSDELIKFLIEDMGYKAKDDAAVLKSLERLDKRRWQRAMEAVYVFRKDKRFFDVVLTKIEAEGDIYVEIAPEGSDDFREIEVLFNEESIRQEGRIDYVKYRAEISDELEIGYYQLKLTTVKNTYRTVLAVAPDKCFVFDKKNKAKMFGFALQLYSLKSKRNWGIGDFTDLANMVELTADNGGDVIGLNPLNVLQYCYPDNASPYASVSRLFLNPMYIDVEKVPFYRSDDKDEELLGRARQSEHIDYQAVNALKMKALYAIYCRLKNHQTDAYVKAFQKFKQNDSGDLHRLAVFQEIAEIKVHQNGQIPAGLETASGYAVEKFALEHAQQIDFFKFLQFEAERQLEAVRQKVKQCGMAIGLYRDLPVGVSKDSAEVWSDASLYLNKSGAGAPPDNYFPLGQKWGLGAFNPDELKERCYKPFIKILRANMKCAGAIRIDHIMGLSRLFVIPDNGVEGTYIRYNEEDMMNILALESHLNECAVVGECIGNVEAGYTEKLLERNIYLLGVLWSERKDDNGTMKEPQEYEEKYFASVGTHDMPPLKAWWFGTEIATMNKLGLYTEEETQKAYHWREHERRLLLEALDRAGVWPQDKLRKGDYIYGENYPEGLEEAVHSYMAKTNSEVFMLMPEDIFQSEKIQNLPGTDIDKYPNWRSKQVFDIENMADSEAFKRNIRLVQQIRES